MKIRFSSLLTGICGSFLAFLGFGCNSDSPGGEILCMYGSPVGSFEIKGKVMSEDGKPISNVKIITTLPDLDSSTYPIVTVTSDSEGKYDTKKIDMVLDRAKVVCIPDENEFEADSVITTLKNVNDPEGSRLIYGLYTEGTVDFTLKKKSGK